MSVKSENIEFSLDIDFAIAFGIWNDIYRCEFKSNLDDHKILSLDDDNDIHANSIIILEYIYNIMYLQ